LDCAEAVFPRIGMGSSADCKLGPLSPSHSDLVCTVTDEQYAALAYREATNVTVQNAEG